MGTASWAVPVGILMALVVVGFVWVWWAFPRAWNRGVKNDMDQVNEATGEERELQRQKNREIIARFARARALERGEIVEEPIEAPPPAYKPTGDVQESVVGVTER